MARVTPLPMGLGSGPSIAVIMKGRNPAVVPIGGDHGVSVGFGGAHSQRSSVHGMSFGHCRGDR